jgi:hypothetical protein
VHNDDLAGVRQMGVAIGIRRGTMGGPASMTDTHMAGQIITAIQTVAQNLQTTLGLHRSQSIFIMYADTGGIVTPVLQLFQSIQQNRRCLTAARISNNAAHCNFLLTFDPLYQQRFTLYNFIGAFFNCFFDIFLTNDAFYTSLVK